ncbi:GDSL-type esterase/lipase family protein [Haloferula sp. A504]|uniref:GDSL-type esterase/lipase family protein n=1 Tax=Haloferula sp. A504 TaxID=3373601 RepID=UPI0031C025F0|nr:GDSL-type esterase/lipase family protein [Verrucomicrobiaceae bacterium E54]
MKHSATLLSCMFALCGLHAAASPPTAEPMPWENPAYETTIRATQAESRPGPEEDPNSWTAWLRHHEDRKRWCTEQEVDLLMVGDSIVFGWSRVGRKVWDEFYGNRKAVNIGSSGDRTYHMLWHFQNGGLDGMKDRNPKLVVMMIGTNNRGIPELHGHDTAYGILALLKEIHAKLPESKILLMPIFPRGDTPEDPGRLRNDQINRIIRSYVDHETVHWLDVGHVFLDGAGRINRELMPDGLHPNEQGYRAWGRAMESMVEELLCNE